MSTLYLSYTAAKRYEMCGERQRQHRYKLVSREQNEKPFLKGRVVHAAFESWVATAGAYPLADWYVHHWPAEEADSTTIWDDPGERVRVYESGIEVSRELEAICREVGFLELRVVPEESRRIKLGTAPDGRVWGMYGQPDDLAYHLSLPIVFVVELKSGTSYDKAQTDWYAAVVAMTRQQAGEPPLRMIELALRPATDQRYALRDITVERMQAQVARAQGVAHAMLAEEWPVRPQGFCSLCEARTHCPDWNRKHRTQPGFFVS